MHDKTDFNNYKKNVTSVSDILNKPEIFTILN
jgi:hypothetical protein